MFAKQKYNLQLSKILRVIICYFMRIYIKKKVRRYNIYTQQVMHKTRIEEDIIGMTICFRFPGFRILFLTSCDFHGILKINID